MKYQSVFVFPQWVLHIRFSVLGSRYRLIHVKPPHAWWRAHSTHFVRAMGLIMPTSWGTYGWINKFITRENPLAFINQGLPNKHFYQKYLARFSKINCVKSTNNALFRSRIDQCEKFYNSNIPILIVRHCSHRRIWYKYRPKSQTYVVNLDLSWMS